MFFRLILAEETKNESKNIYSIVAKSWYIIILKGKTLIII